MPDVSIIPPQLEHPAPQVTPELEQLILDQPLPEPEPEPQPAPNDELEPPLRQQQDTQQPLRHSSRQRRQPACFADYAPHSQVSFEAIVEPTPDLIDKQLQAYMLTNDPDILYLWQAMREPDWPQFQTAMQHEIEEHARNGNWEIVSSSSIPQNAPVLLSG